VAWYLSVWCMVFVVFGELCGVVCVLCMCVCSMW